MKKLLLYIIILNIVFTSYSQEVLDKTTLFSYNIFNENDLYLALEGSWKFNISTFASGNISSAFENLIFNQVPDLEASLWLFNKYFFETKITDESDENIFILGYQNVEGLLQEVRIGNDDLNINSYAGYTPSANIENSPGARIKLGTNNSQHELLGRYTSETNNTIKYKGYSYIEEESFDITNYERELFFILPFYDFEDLDLYRMKNDSLAKVSNSEYVFTSSENLLYLENKEDGNSIYLSIGDRSQIDYEDILYKFINPTNNPGVKTYTPEELWNKYIINIEGKNLLKLTNTGYSPFDQMGVYNLQTLSTLDKDNLEIYLNNEQIINYSIYNNYIIIKDNSLSYDDLETRYPFYNQDQEIYSSGGSGYTSEYILNFQILTPVSEITVPNEAKENSLDITINGLTYTNFTHDKDSGVVTFNKQISAFDEIVINYKTEVSNGTGNLLLSYGSNYIINKNLTFDLSLTSSWDFSSDDYSYNKNENIGALNSRGLLNYESQNFSAELSSAIFASTPDTTNGYMLFEYDQGEINIPVNSIQLSQDSNAISFIKRKYKDTILSYNEISDLDIDSSGGPYSIYNAESEESSEVIVLETTELEVNQFSSVEINLDDYQSSYSWATSFSIDIMNTESNRELTFTFKDEDGSEETTLILSKELTTGSEFKTYTFSFSESEREKLTNLDIITIEIGEGNADLFLLKNMTFKGDSLVTHNSSTDEFNVTTLDSSMKISTTSNSVIGKSIEISSIINSVNIHNYEKMSFTINNQGLLDSSEITLELKDNGEIISELIIPNGLEYGENSITIFTNENKVTINGSTIDGISWNNTKNVDVNSLTFTFENCSEGSMILSEIILEEPIWDLYNQTSLTLEYRPDLSIILLGFPILDNVTLSTNSNFINKGTQEFNITGNTNMDILGSNISTSIYYYESIQRLEYKTIIPSFDFPIKFIDQFSYDTDRYRFEGINYITDNFSLEIEASDTLGESSGLRKSTIEFSTEQKYLFSVESETKLTQNRTESIQDMNSEISRSYISLVPENLIDKKNYMSQGLKLNLNTQTFDMNLDMNGYLTQENSSNKSDTNIYYIKIGNDLSILNISIAPSISSKYSYNNNNSSIESITSGVSEYLSIFKNTNPYVDINLNDLIFSNERTDFYEGINDNINKKLESEFSLKLTNDIPIEDIFNIVIPKDLIFKINKDLSKEESQYTSIIKNSLTGNFTNNPDLKNSITLTREYDIEDNSTSESLDWDLILYKTLKKDISIDISNNLTLSNESSSNILKAEFNWPGKSGPLLILPILDKILDSPYHYDHTEELYLNLSDNVSDFVLGLKHETILTVKDINETQFYIDLGWDNGNTDKLNMEIGLYTTLVF